MKDNIYTALAEVQKKEINPKKKAKGVHNNAYATLEDTWNACRDILNKNNLVINQYVKGERLITELIYTPTKETIRSSMILQNSKGDMQGLGSAITYARRYALTTLIGAIPEDDDGQAASISDTERPFVKQVPPSEKQLQFVNNLLKQKLTPGEQVEFLGKTIGSEEIKTMAQAKNLIDKLMGMPDIPEVKNDQEEIDLDSIPF